MERTFPIPSEAMVSMPDPSTSMLAEAQRRGGLFDLLRRTAGHIGAVGTGLTRASVAIVGVGKSGGGRRKVAAEELMLRNKRRLEGSVGTSTDTEFLGIPRYAPSARPKSQHRTLYLAHETIYPSEWCLQFYGTSFIC